MGFFCFGLVFKSILWSLGGRGEEERGQGGPMPVGGKVGSRKLTDSYFMERFKAPKMRAVFLGMHWVPLSASKHVQHVTGTGRWRSGEGKARPLPVKAYTQYSGSLEVKVRFSEKTACLLPPTSKTTRPVETWVQYKDVVVWGRGEGDKYLTMNYNERKLQSISKG